MKNSIVATIPFDFKGQHFTPSATINLDDFITRELDSSGIYLLVASHNQIGPYSYEHEVLSSSEILFSEPEGIARNFFSAGKFNLVGFVHSYHEQMALHTLASIAKRHLQVDDLEQNPALRQALLDAYQYGKGSF